MIDTNYLNELKEKLKNIEENGKELLLEEIKEKGAGFPNKNWFSDHLPIGCTFTK
jgi:hypothetical protein